MELILLLILAGVVGYFFGRSRRSKTSPPASEQIVDAQAKNPPDDVQPES